jgi:hypothetical protein
LGGVDQSPGSLKSTVPPTNPAALKSTAGDPVIGRGLLGVVGFRPGASGCDVSKSPIG